LGRILFSADGSVRYRGYIAIVGVTYSLLLRSLWSPPGAQKVADNLLHDLVPIMYVAYWLVFIHKGSLLWNDALSWAVYPLVYFFYSLIRGAVTGWYPYPFIDVSKFGYPRVMANAAMFVCAFLTVALLTVAIGRLTARSTRLKTLLPRFLQGNRLVLYIAASQWAAEKTCGEGLS
jgi:hypothetical protein